MRAAPARPGRTCSMSICTRPTMLTTLLSRRPVCLDWKDESRMPERRPDTRPRKGKVCTWGHSTWEGGGCGGGIRRAETHDTPRGATLSSCWEPRGQGQLWGRRTLCGWAGTDGRLGQGESGARGLWA